VTSQSRAKNVELTADPRTVAVDAKQTAEPEGKMATPLGLLLANSSLVVLRLADARRGLSVIPL